GMFRDGRFELSASGAVVLSVPKGPPADQLEKRRPEVEAALAAHLGQAVPLQVTVRAELAEATSTSPEAPASAPPEDEGIDVHALEDAPAAGSGVERLAEAFPGAELVEE
ncbi:MAG: hypothetical protein ABL966_13335, partial [Acidimicrobiales bacterium]